MPDPNITKIQVKVGEEFLIDLSSISSAGYLWQMAACPEEIRHLASEYLSPDRPGIVGGVGRETFRFIAMKGGAYSIKFRRKRSWESKPSLTRTYRIVVSD
jgi:predicted secreted protein